MRYGGRRPTLTVARAIGSLCARQNMTVWDDIDLSLSLLTHRLPNKSDFYAMVFCHYLRLPLT